MGAPTPASPGLLNWSLITALGMIWGAAFMANAVSLEGYSFWTVAAGRVAIGAAILLVVGAAAGQPLGAIGREAGARGWAFAAVLGMLGLALPFALLTWGQQHVPSAFAGVAMGSVPLVVLPLVWLFSPDEGIGPRRVIGMALGFAGLVVLIGPSALRPGETGLALLGQLAILGTAACYATTSVVTRRAPAMPPIALATGTLCAATAVLVPVALWREGWPGWGGPWPTAALVYAAALPTALAAVIRVHVVTTAGSLFMSITAYMVPVWAVIFGAALLGEALPPQLLAALALILGGIAVAQSRALADALAARRAARAARAERGAPS